ncbi:MAG TPA: hypothetical protein VEC36_09700, partial [Patescibacteria group bacterium]|nr:hypothetical protein [Patescibacteria group bacterium]
MQEAPMVTPFLSLPFLAGITPERADSPALLTGTDANAGAFLAEFQKAIMSEAAHDTPEVEVLSPEDSAYDASADTDISFKESAGGIFKNIALKNSQPVQREENNPDVVQSVEQEDCDTLTIATVHIVAPGPDELPTLPAITIREKYYLGNGTFFESFNTESVAIPAETPLRKNTEKSTFKHEKVGKTPALQTEDKYAEIPFKTPQEIVELVLQSVVAPQPETHENVPALKSETADVSPATSTEKTIEFRFPSLPHVPVTFTYGSRVVQAEIPAFPPRETSQLLEQLSTEIDKINRELVQMPAVVEHLAVEHALQILHVPQQEISGEESVGKLISDAGIFPREEKITPHISDGQNPVALKIPFKNRAANNTVAVTEVGSFKNVGVKLKKDENQEIIGGDAPGDLLKNEKNAGETAVVREQISFKNDGAGILQK